MKAQNSKEINKRYLYFGFYLVACIVIAIIVVFMNRKISSVELSKVIAKTSEYDNIYRQQIQLVDRIDTLYVFSNMFRDDKTEKTVLEDIMSRHKQSILSSISHLDQSDVRLYNLLLSRMNNLLDTKDSIQVIDKQEDMVRSDLIRCIDNNNRNSAEMLNIGAN